jgi:hypothetical protein
MGKIKVVERKLRKYCGYAYTDLDLIEIDPTLTDYAYMNTLIHETLHILDPDASETEISRNAGTIAYLLKKAGYGSHRPKRRKQKKISSS